MKKRVITIILVLAMLLPVLQGVSLASFDEGDWVETGTSVNITYHENLLNYMTMNGSVKTQRYTYFNFKNKDGNREEHPVYCIAPDARGAFELVRDDGTTGDGANTAKYTTGDKVTRVDYVKIMEAGYPHNTLSSIGVNSIDEGYYATKMALWMVILNITPSNGRVGINTSHPDQAAAKRVYDAAIAIYKTAQSYMWAGLNDSKVEIVAPTAANSWKLSADGQWYEMTLQVKTNKYIGTDPNNAGDVQLSWDTSTGELPAGTVVLNGSDDITSTMKPLAANKKQEGIWRIQTITICVPEETVSQYFKDNFTATVFPMPTLKALAEDMGAANFYVATYSGGGGQPYLIEGDRKVDVSTAFQTVIPLVPTEYDDPYDMGLRVVKLETGTRIPLEGAVFEFFNPSGQFIGSYSTNSSGEINLQLGEAGLYTVKETVPPQYHILSAHTSQQVQVNIDDVATVTVTNDPYGSLRIEKRDAANGMQLGGAVIQVKHIESGATFSATTDYSGIAEFLNLPVGGYEISELTAPVGYALDSTVHTTAVRPQTQGTSSYTLTNLANPGLRITKLDRATSTPIEGVVFEIWKDGSLYGEYTTNLAGEILLADLPAGTYTAREKSTVAPYVLDTTAQWVEIYAGQGYISELIFLNDLKPGIYLIKLDAATMQSMANAKFKITNVGGTFTDEYTTDVNGEIDLSGLEPGAYQVQEILAPTGYLIDDSIRTIQIYGGENARFVFTNTRMPVLEVLKFDGENYLPGATFRIAKIEDGSHYLDRITDEYGKIHIEDLEPGIYSVKELQPPPGYILNDTEYHMELFPGRTSQLVVNNIRKPDLLIVKTDANTGLPIEGVTYTVKKVDSSTLETVRTDARGEAWMYALDEGVYQIIEQSVPPTHLLDETPQLITLVGGRTGVARFQNYPRPKLRILKVDAVTGQPLANAEFRVTKVDGGMVGEYITDASGEIIIDNLDVARYSVEEFMAPDGYLLYDEYKEILLEPGKTSTLKFDDIRKPTLIITKTNGLTYEPIPNTTYKIEHEQTDGGIYPLGTFKTDANGQIIIKNASPGWHIITETIPAPGFSLPSNPVVRKYLAPGENAYIGTDGNGNGGDVSGDNVVVTSGNDYNLGEEIINYPLNSIVIRKVDANTGELLAGAAFTVRQVSEDISGSSGTLIGRYTTDNSGTIVITGLKAGGYIIEEVQAPPNYLLSENSMQQVWLKADGTSIVETTFANWPYGGILITKVDAVTNKPLANARFRVTNSSGAVIGNSNGEYITDENGEILVPDVKPGSYTITEIEAPEYYVVDTTPQTIKVGVDGGIYKISFKNQPSGTLVILKMDSVTKAPLSGAVFKVTDSTGAVVGTGNGYYTTDATGTISIPHLPKGSYIVQETAAPDGYVLDNTTRTIAVEYGKTYTLEFYNTPKSGVQIIKIDADTKQPLKGAKYTIYRMDGGVVGTYETNGDGVIILDALDAGWYKAAETIAPDGWLIDDTPQDFLVTSGQFIKLTFENRKLASLQIKKIDEYSGAALPGAVFEVRQQNGAFVGEYTTDKSGTASIPAVAPGWFIVKELKAPAGYVLDNTAKTVEVKATVPTVVTFTNKPLSGLQIKKLDSVTKKPLAGAVFKVTDSLGVVVGTANGEYTTDSNGTILISGLAPGAYIATEIRCPEGYIMDSTPKTIEVGDGKLYTLTFENTPVLGLQIRKIDEETRKPISGVEFAVVEMNGKQIGTYRTDSQGLITLPELSAGWYTVSEVKAADGYIINTMPYNVEVKDGKTAALEITNKKGASILLRKIDSVTGKGIYGVTFLLSDANRNPVGEYISDQDGYVWIDKMLEDGKYFLREIKPAPGYLNDDEVKTIYITGGKCTEITWKNTPAKGQIVITKLSSDYNPITNLPEGSPLEGAVFEVRNLAGNLIETITSDSRGIAATRPLGPDIYVVTEVSPPTYYTGTDKELIAQIKHDGDIIRYTVYNKSISIGVTVDKKGNNQVQCGATMRYDLYNVSNTSSAPLSSFYLHDRIPTDAVRITKLFTGTWNQRLNYSIYFKTNYKDYRVLAAGLQSHINYELSLHPNVLGLMSGEYVTDIRWEFGTVNAGFKDVQNPFMYVQVLNGLPKDYQIINRADAGGKHREEWQTARTTWITTVFGTSALPPSLPKTGY